MTIYQFESGHGIGPGTEGLGKLVPLFTLRTSIQLVVLAGDDLPNEREPHITVDVAHTVQVTWRLYRADEDANGLLVGMSSRVLHEDSTPFLESQLYADLEAYESPQHKDTDFQMWARKAHTQLVALHGQYLAQRGDGGAIPEVPDPTADPVSVDAHTPIANRVASMRKVLTEQCGMLGVFDKLDEDGRPLVLEGAIDLRNALLDDGVEVDRTVLQELLALPILSTYGDGDDDFGNDALQVQGMFRGGVERYELEGDAEQQRIAG